MKKEMKKVPAVRFKGFTGDWEQRKFDEITKRSSETAISTDLTPAVEYEDVVPEAGSLNKDIRTKGVHKKGIAFDESQILYGKLRPYLHNWLNPKFKGVAVGDWWVLSPIDGDKDFLYGLIQTQKFDEVANLSSGSKMPRADWNLVSNTEFQVSKSISEQKKIGSYFSKLDNLITLHQRKSDQLKKLKAYFLQNLFPDKGEKVPKIRFKGFTGDWEERKIGDCFDERKEGMPNGELLSVTINEGVKRFSELERHDSSNQDKSKYKKVCIGDIAYNSMRMWQGASGVSTYEGIVSPAYTILKPKNGINSKFVSYLFKKKDILYIFQVNSQGITSDNWNLKFPILSKISIRVPASIKEQNKIAKQMEKIDDIITLHQQKIAQFQAVKKFLLQNLFV